MKLSAKMILCFGLAYVPFVPATLLAGQSNNGSTAAKDAGKKQADTSRPPSAQEIANAKSQGLVWVNTSTRVYHKDGENYGKTKHGKFVTEAEARQQGFREAKDNKPAPHKKDQSGLDDSANTHSSTPPKH